MTAAQAGLRRSVGDDLQPVQPRIGAVAGEQHVMAAGLDDSALFHDDDQIRLAHRRQAMGDDQRGAVLHQPGQRLLDETLQEESNTDESLTALADAKANAKAQGKAA